MRYQPLELGEAGQPECPDQFTLASTLFCPGSERLLLTVLNNSVYIQLGNLRQGEGSGLGSIQWQGEWRMVPVVASLGRTFDALRVRNYLPGAKAVVVAVVD